MRILLQDFLQREAVNCFLTSRKTKRDTMVHNLFGIRHVSKEVIGSGSEQAK
jgi:hypothetical protein